MLHVRRGARQRPTADAIVLEFRIGGVILIPRRAVPGLVRASTSALESSRVFPAGDALSWPSLAMDVYVPSMVEQVSPVPTPAPGCRQPGNQRTFVPASPDRRQGVAGARRGLEGTR